MISKVLLQTAQEQVERLIATWPGVPPLDSIRRQLAYLIEYTDGLNDGGHLADVNLGVLAMREVEPRDVSTAELLYEVAEAVRLARGESGWPK